MDELKQENNNLSLEQESVMAENTVPAVEDDGDSKKKRKKKKKLKLKRKRKRNLLP